MIRTIKSIFLSIAFIIIISFILPGCYTQLARPRVDTDNQNYEEPESQAEDQPEEYYQDEGTPAADDSRDVYINNYYPFYGVDYYDYWYWNSYPYRWGYLGPYPDYWWDPYGHWWTPGWYVGFSYYNYGWAGYPRYYDSYYRHGHGYGYGGNYVPRNYTQRPFDRRSIGGIDRAQRVSDSNTSLAKPQGPTRVERPGQTLATPDVRDRSIAPDRKSRTVRDMVDQRLRDKTNPTKRLDEGRQRTAPDKRPLVTKPGTVDNQPRQSKRSTKSGVIEQAPSKKYVPGNKQKRSNSTPKRSSSQKSNINTRSSNSNNQVSKPAAPSYTPRSSSSSSSRSTSPRSSSSPNRSSRSSSSSKSSGSSKKNK